MTYLLLIYAVLLPLGLISAAQALYGVAGYLAVTALFAACFLPDEEYPVGRALVRLWFAAVAAAGGAVS